MLRHRIWTARLTVLFALACCAADVRAQLAARQATDWISTLESPQRIAGQKVDLPSKHLSTKVELAPP